MLFTPWVVKRYLSAAVANCAVVGSSRKVSFEPSESGEVSEAKVPWMTGIPAALMAGIDALRPADTPYPKITLGL